MILLWLLLLLLALKIGNTRQFIFGHLVISTEFRQNKKWIMIVNEPDALLGVYTYIHYESNVITLYIFKLQRPAGIVPIYNCTRFHYVPTVNSPSLPCVPCVPVLERSTHSPYNALASAPLPSQKINTISYIACLLCKMAGLQHHHPGVQLLTSSQVC